MISKTLIEQIEDHSARLAQEVLAAIRNDIRTRSYRQLSEASLRGAVEELFGDLGHWLSSRTDYAVERRYKKIGRERFLQGVELSEMVYALSLVRAILIRFLRGSAIGDAADLYVEYELALSICDFTEKTIYYASRGYEDARRANEKASETAGADRKESMPQPVPEEAWDPADEWDPNISRGGDVGETSG